MPNTTTTWGTGRITTKNTMVAIHVSIIGIKNIPGSNGFMAFSVINCEMTDC